MRSAARKRRSTGGSIEQRASTSPLADVKYKGRPARRYGNTRPIMKSAVCSRSSTASRSPPTVTLGTFAVIARPIGFMRRSRIVNHSWADGRRDEFNDAPKRDNWDNQTGNATADSFSIAPRDGNRARNELVCHGSTCSAEFHYALFFTLQYPVQRMTTVRASVGICQAAENGRRQSTRI